MPDLEHSRLLMELAKRDLKTLNAMLDNAVFCDESFGFHAQQAVEKAFKAWLCLHEVEYPHTHDLNVLFGLLQDAQASGIDTFDSLIDLSDFAVQFRYDTYSDEPVDREETCKEVARLVDHVEKLEKS